MKVKELFEVGNLKEDYYHYEGDSHHKVLTAHGYKKEGKPYGKGEEKTQKYKHPLGHEVHITGEKKKKWGHFHPGQDEGTGGRSSTELHYHLIRAHKGNEYKYD